MSVTIKETTRLAVVSVAVILVAINCYKLNKCKRCKGYSKKYLTNSKKCSIIYIRD